MRRFAVWGAVCIVAAVLLAVLLVADNPGPFGLLGTAELLLSLLWISVVLNGCFAVLLIIADRVARVAGIRRPDTTSSAYWLSGLLAANCAWICINYLPLLQVWETSWRPYLSWSLIAQAALLAAGAVLIFAAGVLFRSGSPLSAPPIVALALAALLMCSAVGWSRIEARRHLVYDLEDLIVAASAQAAPLATEPTTQAAAAAASTASEMPAVAGTEGPALPAAPETAEVPTTGSGVNGAPVSAKSPVIVLGIDGADWQVVAPLVSAGKLPNFARLIRGGAIAYLDNGDESFTWRIWPTIFSGREVSEHGVYGPVKIVLPATGAEIPNLLYNRPENNSFYGISGLYGLVPSLGIWLEAPNDPHAKMVWDIASDYQKKVVVAQVFGNLPFARPVYPINGAMITFAGPYSGAQAYPPEILPLARSLREGGTHAQLLAWTEHVADATIKLFREFDVDLGIYYTHTLDGIAHDDWDFNSRDSRWLRPAPSESDHQAWERLLLDNLDEPIFHGYQVVDRIVGRFLDAFPGATFLLCSDHGWTYTPLLHKGSPNGVLIVNGPGIRRGVMISGARTRDITPTLAALLSLPQSVEVDGSVLEAAFVAPKALTYVDTYGEPSRPDQSTDVVDPQLLERLRALGYIR